MKLAVFGDLHYQENTPRAEHALDVLDAALRDATEQGATHFYFLGDVFEGIPTPTEYRAILERIVGKPVVIGIVRGNHEDFNAYAFFELFRVGLHISVADTDFITDHFREADVLLIPYPVRHRAPFHDLVTDGTITGSIRAAASRIEERIQRTARWSTENYRPLIVLGHFTIGGMTTRDTEFERHQANEVVVPVSAFAPAALTIVGHIHRAQDITPTIIGAGDLYRTSFSELGDDKSYVLVTVKDAVVTWERRPTQARGMMEVEIALDAVTESRIQSLAREAAGREIKVRITMDEEQAPRYNPAAFAVLETAAAYVVLERQVRPTQRVRAPEITVTMSPADQLAAWLRATETSVSTDRMERLLHKIDLIR
jgi:calcineurin-like phosphoesterase family protein